MKAGKHIFFFIAFLIFISFSCLGFGETKKQVNNGNLFHSPTAGFSITKPNTWSFGTMEQISASRASVRLRDKELEEQIRQRATAPLVVILKYQEPYDDLNPSVQVGLRPLGRLDGKSPAELMKIVIPMMQKSLEDFKAVESIQETMVGGHKAAYTKINYTVANVEGRKFPTQTRYWIIPRGKFMFMVTMAGTQEGANVCEKEFADILRSIQIEN